MRTYLQILKIAAERGYVTNYMLTNEKATPRFGGQVAHDSFEHLEKIGLLKSKQAISEKKRPRRDLILTPKGIIACMALSEFQQRNKLRNILERPSYNSNDLAVTLKVFNNEGVRRQYDIKSQISPATILFKELFTHGFNLELKDEDKITQDLKTIEEEGFIESLKIPLFEFPSVFTKMAQDIKYRKGLQRFIDIFSREKVDPEVSQLVEDDMKKMLHSMTLFFTSPELRAWMRMKKKKGVTNPIRELEETLTTEGRLSTVDFKDLNIGGIFEYVFKTLKEQMELDLLANE